MKPPKMYHHVFRLTEAEKDFKLRIIAAMRDFQLGKDESIDRLCLEYGRLLRERQKMEILRVSQLVPNLDDVLLNMEMRAGSSVL